MKNIIELSEKIIRKKIRKKEKNSTVILNYPTVIIWGVILALNGGCFNPWWLHKPGGS